MYNSVETAHTKMLDKFEALINAVTVLTDNEDIIQVNTMPKHPRKVKNAKANRATDALFGDLILMKNTCVDTSQYNITKLELEELKSNYYLLIVCILNEYYSNDVNNNYSNDVNNNYNNNCNNNCNNNIDLQTKEYYRIITSENYMSLMDIATNKIHGYITIIQDTVRELRNKQLDDIIARVSGFLKTASHCTIDTSITKENHEICDCGARMNLRPELSELCCGECGLIRELVGAVFRDEQFFPQDGQKTKHSGYDTSRHYRFHMERLQALENKVFPQEVLDNIEYIIKRDRYNRSKLTCENIREILKDPFVNQTKLNYHAPSLVKLFGGPAPPTLTYEESRRMYSLFTLVMNVFESLGPGGNKPYYPFWIYKIAEQIFARSSKIRILEYIHLQSHNTVVKNDIYFRQICDTINDEKILKYTPTLIKF